MTWLRHVCRGVRSYWTVIAKESARLADHTIRTLITVRIIVMLGCDLSFVAVKLSSKTIRTRGRRAHSSRPLASFTDFASSHVTRIVRVRAGWTLGAHATCGCAPVLAERAVSKASVERRNAVETRGNVAVTGATFTVVVVCDGTVDGRACDGWPFVAGAAGGDAVETRR